MSMMTPAQYILCKFVPSSTRPGKTDKFPLDCAGSVVTAHDPQHWMDYATARTMADLYGPAHGVGFVYTAAAGYWFLDIDGCRSPGIGEWSALALDLCARFAGCWIEVSQSGNGLHIVGRGVIPPHGCKNVALGLELYHTGRFMALGYCDHATGSPEFDATPVLAALVAEYFAPGESAETVGWTHTPMAEWRGPTDDDDLIRRACLSRSAAGAFGARASFSDLWDADPVALAAAFPDPEGVRQYDASSADAALAQHLAFWTGNNCERIQRLMGQSALRREKYEREDYLPRTVLSATSRQMTWCVDKVMPAQSVTLAPTDRNGSAMIDVEAQKQLFAGCVHIEDRNRIFTPDGRMLDEARFKIRFGGRSFPMDRASERVSRNAWECFTDSQAVRFPKVHGVCFRPEMTPGGIVTEENSQLLNTYMPVETLAIAGDATPFINLMGKLYPNARDRSILLSYIASMVQNIGRKFQYWPVLQGTEGNGKSAIIRCLSHAIGQRYTHLPDIADMAKNGMKFNSWVDRTLFVGVEEIYVPHKKDFLESFKTLVTNDRIQIEAKGADQVMGDNRANGLMCTNHKDGVPITVDTRRYCVLYSAQQSRADIERDGMGGNYFPDLYDWFKGQGKYASMGANYGYAVVNHYLRNYPVAAEFDPAGSCQQAPRTSSTDEAIAGSMSVPEQEVHHAITQGWPGFRGGWISSHYLDRLLKDNDMERAVPRNKRRALMESLGYVTHPGLKDGRVNNPVQPDGPMSKPRLFVTRDHEARGLMVPVDIARAYEQAQSEGATVSTVRPVAVSPGASVLAFGARPAV